MDFLIEEGFQEKLITDLESKYDESVIDLIEIECENIKDVIRFLKRIGIKKVDELMLGYIELFFKDVYVVKKTFDKYNIREVVNAINDDVTYIENI